MRGFRRFLSLLPLAVYLGLAVARLLWVPCTWTLWHPPVFYSRTLPVWQVTREHIRFDLIGIEEAALLGSFLLVYWLWSLAFEGFFHPAR